MNSVIFRLNASASLNIVVNFGSFISRSIVLKIDVEMSFSLSMY